MSLRGGKIRKYNKYKPPSHMRRGVTLIELVVVLTLFTLILLLAFTKYPVLSAKSKADADKTASAISCVIECVGYYKTLKNAYPATLQEAVDLGDCMCLIPSNLTYGNDANGVYLCLSKDVQNLYDITYLKILKNEIPNSYLNLTCPSDTNADVSVGQTAYLTVWLSR